MANGVIYGITNWSITYALDARTGKELWRYDPKVDQPVVRPKICCGVVNRGLAIYEGKIFVPVIDGRLVALDAAKGTEIWSVQTTPTDQPYTMTMAPRIAKNKVIVGNAGAEKPVRGYFSAYDADTGKLEWRFYTVPGDPSKGFENKAMEMAAKTWGGEWWKMGGGGTVWDSITYDPGYQPRFGRHRQRRSMARRTAAIQGPGQPLHRIRRRRRCRHRRVQVALPVCARRFLGLRQRPAIDRRRSSNQRPEPQGRHAGEQERVLLRDRSNERKTDFRGAVRAGELGQRNRSAEPDGR